MRWGVRLLAQYLTNQWTEFQQTLVDDIGEATDELSFEGRGVKVKVTARSNIWLWRRFIVQLTLRSTEKSEMCEPTEILARCTLYTNSTTYVHLLPV